MPITHPATAQGTSSAATYSTGSITVNAGETLTVAIANASNINVSSVVFNSGSQSLSLVSRKAQSTTVQAEVWEITSPSAGSGTVTITNASVVLSAAIAFTSASADSGASWRDAAATATSGNGAAQSITVTSATNDEAIGVVAIKNTNSTWTADASPVGELIAGGVASGTGTSHVRVSVLTETGAASTSPSGSTGAARDWAMVGFNINIAPSAGSDTPINALRPSMRGGLI